MRTGIKQDLRTAAVAVVASALMLATPAIASKVNNSDKVDGFHAVGAGVSAEKRAKKLIATTKSGTLPLDILAEQPVRAVLPLGEAEEGVYSAWGDNGYLGDGITFRSTLPLPIPGTRTTFVSEKAPTTAECPGPGEVVPDQWLCVYERYRSENLVADGVIVNPKTGQGGVNSIGFMVFFEAPTGSENWSYGTWAVRSGSVVGPSSSRPGADGAPLPTGR